MDRDNSGTIQLIGLEQQMEAASELALDIGRGDVLDTMTDRENDPVQSLLQPLNIPIPDPRNGMFTGAQSRVSPIRGRSPPLVSATVLQQTDSVFSDHHGCASVVQTRPTFMHPSFPQ
jgi:hypothetical protein